MSSPFCTNPVLARQRLKARVQGTEEPETLDAELIKELEDDLAALATSRMFAGAARRSAGIIIKRSP